MKIKLFATALVFVLASAIAHPAFAGVPETPEDCQRIYEGNDAAIQVCIEGLRQ